MGEKVIVQYWDRSKGENGEAVTVTPDTPLPTTGGGAPPDGSVGTDQLQDSAVTTAKIEDGSVTDDKLATPKIDKPNPLIPSVVIGTTLSTNELGLVGYSQSPMADQLVMYQFGGQVATADPQADGDAATKGYVDGQINGIPNVTTLLASIDPIADPTTATTEDIANKVNEILAALKGS